MDELPAQDLYDSQRLFFRSLLFEHPHPFQQRMTRQSFHLVVVNPPLPAAARLLAAFAIPLTP